MVVKVSGAILPKLLGAREIIVTPDGDTLGDVIEQLIARYGQVVKEELFDKEGNLDYCYAFFANGERLESLSDKIEGNELLILSAVAGG